MHKSLSKTATACFQDEGITYDSIATVIFHSESLELKEELVSDNHLPTGLGRTEGGEVGERWKQIQRWREGANWTTPLHEQTHFKPPHEWWRRDGESHRVSQSVSIHLVNLPHRCCISPWAPSRAKHTQFWPAEMKKEVTPV